MPRRFSYVIPPDANGQTVQTFLRGGVKMSQRTVVRLKRAENGLMLDGVPVRTVDRLAAGQTLTVNLPEDTVTVEGIPLPLDIVFEDDALLAVDKPPYLAVHPSAGKPDPTLANAVVAYFERQGEPHLFRPLSRLDRNTSGLLLCAKDAHTAHLLTGKVSKDYLAIVTGVLSGEGVVDRPIRVKEGCCITREVGPGGKESVTKYRSLWTNGDMSLVELRLLTGRTHQIRVHMAWLGHPLLGDTMYGTDQSLPRQALHCHRLVLEHPETHRPLTLESPLPSDMREALLARGYPPEGGVL